ncbi:HAD family hydrolase [Phycicoccus endophyticus]|uniref:HAD family hydrolase n=1 Tax=Phycicoccus endophyticus TaxID=1690220 RepID=UPI001CB6E202|nr:HAD-IA family hydrolase [Phycicoccus endophyticus]
MTGSRPVAWDAQGAVLFDLDGVLTPTAEVHMAAWARMFGDLFAGLDTTRPDLRGADTSAYTDADYFAHVDGKPRYQGVADLLAARGIRLPQGSPEDPPEALTVCGLGNRKNVAFTAILEREGVRPYPGSVALLDHLRGLGVPVAVVSSSANAPAVLAAAGLAERFDTVVDGRVAADLGLAGKPQPDTFLHAATACGCAPERAVVVEDAVSGVRAGAAGGFGLVVGVDRGAGADALRAAGADLVVADLGELA